MTVTDTSHHLPFWSFFEDLELQLGYERWIDKYKLFLQQLFSSDIAYTDDRCPPGLVSLCKALYLQDIRDEARFLHLLETAWKCEKQYWENHFEYVLRELARERRTDAEVKTPDLPEVDDSDDKQQKKKTTTSEKDTQPPASTEKSTSTPTSAREYFFTPPAIPKLSSLPAQPSAANEKRVRYNLQEEYLPITQHEMAKAWQYLRHHEKGLPTDQINIPATIDRIARERIFMTPEYIIGKQNRQDTMIFFVDRNGSMTPFHELSRRLIHTAKTHGGHTNACTYFFQNAPMGYVYDNSNLTHPRKTKEVLSKANRHFTIAIIISDAGYARAFGGEQRHTERLAVLEPFLDLLNDHCAHILWLNPMPENRWHIASAEFIQRRVLKMAPLITSGQNPFQSTLRNVLRSKPTTVQYG
jgi:uncharacterized protein with von Willebrand factor type A (vWA) domain